MRSGRIAEGQQQVGAAYRRDHLLCALQIGKVQSSSTKVDQAAQRNYVEVAACGRRKIKDRFRVAVAVGLTDRPSKHEIEGVVAGAAVQRIVAGTAAQVVVTCPPCEGVVTQQAEQAVGTAIAG